MWVEIPNHEIYGHYNTYKTKYNAIIRKTTALFREMDTLKLIGWDSQDISYFEEGKISEKGLTSYWMAICCAFEVWDCKQLKGSSSGNLDKDRKTTKSFMKTDKSKLDAKHFHREHPQMELVHSWGHSTTNHFRLPALPDRRQ